MKCFCLFLSLLALFCTTNFSLANNIHHKPVTKYHFHKLEHKLHKHNATWKQSAEQVLDKIK